MMGDAAFGSRRTTLCRRAFCRVGFGILFALACLDFCVALAASPTAPATSPASTPPQQSAIPPDALTPDGGRYYGALVDGKFQGRGRIEWDSGENYVGTFDKGLYSGEGRFTLSNGAVYEGSFRHGQFDGEGRFTKGKVEYRGEFKDGEYSGHGTLASANGSVYEGQMVHGQMQGKGRLVLASGEIYEGDFADNAFAGEGSYVDAAGYSVKGHFANWKANGHAIAIDAEGNRYEADFIEGVPRGRLVLTGKDGTRYEGESKGWLPDGKGVMHLANGDVYTGGFTGGLYDGVGTLVYAKPAADGRTQVSGKWSYGRLDDPEARRKIRERVESALYGQRKLLDASLATLEPRDPYRINLYLLAVAGGGTQEVFHREVDFVRNEFDTTFGTRGHSLVLVNSRNTVENRPMATITSIRESLAAIASSMDKQKDILFVYLTSHGSADHELALNLDGMSLPALTAKELGELVAATGIKWKVVVVSACYAGGFIDNLKDDSTLVMTAARRDRTSFGCADDNDFTYFGRAYFKESLRGSQSFEQAFHKADVLIREWEDKDAEEDRKSARAGAKEGEKAAPAKAVHSEPQIYEAPAIETYLKTWRAQLARPQ